MGAQHAELPERDVRAALEELLAWDSLRRSPQLAAFLSYVVEARLTGDEGTIKAYAIAVDVFGRGDDFDPQTDPIVRVQARRLRQLLNDFYDQRLGHASARIELPVGSYVPEFHPVGDHKTQISQTGEPRAFVKRQAPWGVWFFAISAVVLLISAALFWPRLVDRISTPPASDQPHQPLVIVEEISSLDVPADGSAIVAGLALDLMTGFERFPDVEARYGGAHAELTPDEMARAQSVFVLSGVARPVPDGLQYGVVLTRADDGNVVATVDATISLAAQNGINGLEDISRYVVRRLASPRGPLHEAARQWLAAHISGSLELYPCLVAYGLYLGRWQAKDAAVAQACGETLAPHYPEALAISASMKADEAWRKGSDTTEGQALLAEAQQSAQSARDAAPSSAFIWAVLGQVATVSGDIITARDSYNSALQLNPGSVDALASYAYITARMGEWDTAIDAYSEAVRADASAPGAFHVPAALYALRNGDYAQAVAYAQLFVDIFPDIAVPILVASGGNMRDISVVNAYLPRLMAGQRFRRSGILPALSSQISDPELLRQLSTGMSLAGVPLDRLALPF